MKIYSFIITAFAILGFCKESKAQIILNNAQTVQEIDSLTYYSPENFLGTFQIIHQTKEREIFTHDLYFEIETLRKDDDVVMWQKSNLTIIRIFPRSMIMPPMNYRVPDQEIVHIDEAADQQMEIDLNR